jgi:acetyl-CoA synthetase
MFSVFGPEPIRERMTRGHAAVLVTSARLYERKVEPIRETLPALRHVLLVDVDDDSACPAGTLSLPALLARSSERFAIAATSPDDPALLHFTSGTTGTPKGALHVHGAALAHYVTSAYALDMHPDDVYWCTADPGWVTGTSYGIIAPLLHGLTQIVDEAEFDAERWYQTLQDERVTLWYTAPTALRMLMRIGPELPKKFDLSRLRFVASVGEPLNPEVVVWGERALGLPIHDNWWQTETGGIMIANYASMAIRPGSMGKPLPGIDVALIRRRDDGGLDFVDKPDTEGELAIRRGWPSMFRAYLGAPERYAKCFLDDYYLSGDLMTRDADGYYWFVGRADDVIKSAGHLVGPFEVENALMEHPAVAEVGVVGMPDPIAGEFVKAFVCLHRDRTPDESLRRELLAHARSRLGPAVAPREIEFVADLPHTRSGKLMRRLLKARELGLPEGDLSTLERAEESP